MKRINPPRQASVDIKKISQFLIKYSLTIYAVLVSAAIGVAILFVLALINTGPGEGSLDASMTSFDEATIQQLEEDSRKSEQSNVELPSGRINPFST